ncbi:unnamed protein product [Chironomus riparius]|uniref:Monocarboxylate transporter n=1 Tax=Chironomus riparius TaxID=315576 RepID=A0A9N9WQS8_9DIPT|nr:unnamed protein product [Chironomus riparius]
MSKDVKSISYIYKRKKSGTGSWKWSIVLAYGAANLLIIPCLTSFGLIFKDKFKELNFSAIEATLILNLNSALGMTLGLFNGVLLKTFGFRKIAFIGGTLFSAGITSTAFATTFHHFLITYSIIASIGMGLCSSSFQLALNTYFRDDRNKAFGIGATITGFGPILFPHLISNLLNIYGSQGCILIIGGLTMNIVCAALLLRPYNLTENSESKALNASNAENGSMYKPTPSLSKNSTHLGSLETISDAEGEYLETCPIFHDVDTQSIYGFDVVLHPLTNSDEIIWKDLDYKFKPRPIVRSQSEHHIRQRVDSIGAVSSNDDEVFEEEQPQSNKRWFESGSIVSVNLGSSIGIFHEEEKAFNIRKSQSRMRVFDDKSFLGRRASLLKMNLLQRRATVAAIPENDLPRIEEEPLTPKPLQKKLEPVHHHHPQPPVTSTTVQQPIKKKTTICDHIRNGWKRFVKVFDLGLLNDKIYLNIMVGISFAIFAEINFSLLTPFILNEFHYTTEHIATFMSILATVDIFCRFISPFIGDYFKQPARIMFMYALFMLIIMRTSLICTNSYQGILIIAIGMGLAKGVRQVYMSCIIPSYIPLDRLAAASGIQMVANGIVLLSMGSSIGIFRDLFGSYKVVVIFINIVTFITLVLWTTELIYMKHMNSKRAKEMEQNQIPELCKFDIEVN